MSITRPVPPARFWLGLPLLVLGCAAAFFPDVVRLDRWTPFAQLVAFRPVLVATGVLVGMVLALWRRTRPPGLVIMVTAMVGAALVVPRVTSDAPRSATGGSLAVLAANVGGSDADVSRLAQVIRRREPDVVVLPEATAAYRMRLTAALPAGAYRGRSGQAGSSVVAATSLLVSRELGPVRFRTHPRAAFSVLSATGGGLGRARVVAFHATPPLPLSGLARWKEDLSLLRQWCGSPPATIVAGDYNAALDHSILRGAMRGCTDVAAARGRGLYGTWPSGWPPWLATQIDHVLVTRSITPRGVAFVDIPGTDHRAVLARVALG